ncbi:hypothetical protein DITRI_Ditri08aG0017500 [Diplodiscus trichospermus]
MPHGEKCEGYSIVTVYRYNPLIKHGSGRRSLPELSLVDRNPLSGNVSLQKQFNNEEEYKATVEVTKSSEDISFILQATEQKTNQSDTGIKTNDHGTKIVSDGSFLLESESSNPRVEGIAKVPLDNDNFVIPEIDDKSGALSAPSSMYHFYETGMADLSRKNGILEVQLAAALASRDAAERTLASVLKSKEETEKRFADTVKMELHPATHASETIQCIASERIR